jgi:hypothetical protein
VTYFEYQRQNENLVVARVYGSIAEARVAQATLDSFGIDAQLTDQATIGLDWSYSAALGGVKLLVPGDEVLWALHYLSQVAEPVAEVVEYQPQRDDEDTMPACESCGGDRVYPIDTKKKVGVVLLFASIIGIPFALVAMMFPAFRSLLGSQFECRECSARF